MRRRTITAGAVALVMAALSTLFLESPAFADGTLSRRNSWGYGLGSVDSYSDHIYLSSRVQDLACDSQDVTVKFEVIDNMGNGKFNWENRARNGCGGGVVSRGTPVSRSSLGMYGAYGTVEIKLCHVFEGKSLCGSDAPIGTISYDMG